MEEMELEGGKEVADTVMRDDATASDSIKVGFISLTKGA